MKSILPLCLLAAAAASDPARAAERPNVIYIMADELGYFEPGFMGGRTIQTPNLDRLAAGGLRFNNLLAGSSVCAPTRCCLLTGKHSGHTSVRANGGGTPLRAEEETIASMLKKPGYATGGFGKWGCGGRGSTGVPGEARVRRLLRLLRPGPCPHATIRRTWSATARRCRCPATTAGPAARPTRST